MSQDPSASVVIESPVEASPSVPPSASVMEEARVVTPSAPPTTTFTEALVQPTIVQVPRNIGKVETRRINALKEDTRIETFDAHRVLCKMCGSWVRLHNVRTHDLWNWQRHAEKCELRPGHMDPHILQARAEAAAAATSASINHDYSLRQRPADTPVQSPVEQTASARRKVSDSFISECATCSRRLIAALI